MVKNPPAYVGDAGSIPELSSTPGGGNGNPFQYSCLGNPMDKEAWQAIVYGVTKESDISAGHSEATVSASAKGTATACLSPSCRAAARL